MAAVLRAVPAGRRDSALYREDDYMTKTRIEVVARALHEAHKPWCDYTYPFDHPMSGREVYETLAKAAIQAIAEDRHKR